MPNAYINKERMIAKTIDTKQNDMEPLKDKDVLFNNHAFYGFYGEEPDYVMNQLTITFGSKGQEFFTKTNLTEFSFVAGLNVLPEPTMSLFIQLVVIIGSGLSLLVLLIFPGTSCSSRRPFCRILPVNSNDLLTFFFFSLLPAQCRSI